MKHELCQAPAITRCLEEGALTEPVILQGPLQGRIPRAGTGGPQQEGSQAQAEGVLAGGRTVVAAATAVAAVVGQQEVRTQEGGV